MHPALRKILPPLALVALTWFVFGPATHFPSINYDDPGYVFDNPNVAQGLNRQSFAWAFTHVLGGNWHPLTTLSHMLDVQLFGLDAGRHHLTNVLLHMIAAVFLFVALQKLTNATWSSAFVAAVFAVHPLRAESVVWIAERKDVLSGVCFMLTLIAYGRYARRRSIVNYVTMSILFALGLLAKPMLVTVPLVLLLLDHWPLQRTGWWKLIAEKMPLFVLSAGSCVATLLAQKQALGTTGTYPISWRIENAIVSYVIYLRQIFWPTDLALFYPHPEHHLSILQVVLAAGLLLAITAVAFVSRKRFPYALTGWLWYLIMLAPVLGVIQVGLQGHADRYTYLPQIGLTIAVTWLIVDLTRACRLQRELLAGLAVVLLASLTFAARTQVGYWRDDETLWSHTLDVTIENDVAHTNLSEILIRENRPNDAVPQAQEAIRIRGDSAQAYNNLGVALLRIGQITRAAACFKRSHELRPEGVNAASTLSWIYATSPDPALRNGAMAVEIAQRALRETGGTNLLLRQRLAAAYAEKRQFNDAIRVATEALTQADAQHDATMTRELQLNIRNYEQHLPLR